MFSCMFIYHVVRLYSAYTCIRQDRRVIWWAMTRCGDTSTKHPFYSTTVVSSVCPTRMSARCTTQQVVRAAAMRTLNDITGTCETYVYNFSFAFSSSLRLPINATTSVPTRRNGCAYQTKRERNPRSSLSLIRWGTLLIPCAHTAWFSLGSRRTSKVPIALRENSRMDLIAHGARFLNERPCTRLCRWMVYSRVTTSWSAERVFPPVCGRW